MDLAHEAMAKFFPADQVEGVEFKQTSGKGRWTWMGGLVRVQSARWC